MHLIHSAAFTCQSEEEKGRERKVEVPIQSIPIWHTHKRQLDVIPSKPIQTVDLIWEHGPLCQQSLSRSSLQNMSDNHENLAHLARIPLRVDSGPFALYGLNPQIWYRNSALEEIINGALQHCDWFLQHSLNTASVKVHRQTIQNHIECRIVAICCLRSRRSIVSILTQSTTTPYDANRFTDFTFHVESLSFGHCLEWGGVSSCGDGCRLTQHKQRNANGKQNNYNRLRHWELELE